MADIELVEIAKVRPHPRNRRQGDIGEIAGMIAETGFHGAVIVQRKRRVDTCCAGWHRMKALESIAAEGYTHEDGTHETYEQIAARVSMPPIGKVPAEPLRITDEIALKKVLQDNRANDLAGYDEASLAEDLRALAEFDPEAGLRGTGFDGDDLDDMLRSLTAPEPVRGGNGNGTARMPEWVILIECHDEDDHRTLLAEMMDRGLTVRAGTR